MKSDGSMPLKEKPKFELCTEIIEGNSHQYEVCIGFIVIVIKLILSTYEYYFSFQNHHFTRNYRMKILHVSFTHLYFVLAIADWLLLLLLCSIECHLPDATAVGF